MAKSNLLRNTFFSRTQLSYNTMSNQVNNKPGMVTDGNNINNYDNMNNVDGSGKLWNDPTRNVNINGMAGPGAQSGTDRILLEDGETYKNRMYGYIIMASSVVVLAVLMVSTFPSNLTICI